VGWAAAYGLPPAKSGRSLNSGGTRLRAPDDTGARAYGHPMIPSRAYGHSMRPSRAYEHSTKPGAHAYGHPMLPNRTYGHSMKPGRALEDTGGARLRAPDDTGIRMPTGTR
jgi:hypothetical protein